MLNTEETGLIVPEEYICISFDNYSNYAGDTVSDGILTKAVIYYSKARDNSDEYSLAAKIKTISLQEAEALLYKGYVFGGHSCPLCMAMQDKISFEDYDYVDIQYVFGYDYALDKPTFSLPFYAFYKKIGTSENGNSIYAQTYVSAVKVSGYDEYFEDQKCEPPGK